MDYSPSKPFVSLREFLFGNNRNVRERRIFEIPDYQRGYVWGQRREHFTTDSATYLMQTLVKAFDESNKASAEVYLTLDEYGEPIAENKPTVFLQGLTVSIRQGNPSTYVLVDGQQRITFFYLLLQALHKRNGMEVNAWRPFDLKYKVRKASNEYLCNSHDYEFSATDYEKGEVSQEAAADYQDIHFFVKTRGIIAKALKDIEDKAKFLSFVLDEVKFLVIEVPKESALDVFKMMNGLKAVMRQEELIKAELFRLAALPAPTNRDEADALLRRRRLADSWEAWARWWNRADVKAWLWIDRPMLLLLQLLLDKKEAKEVTLEAFCNYCRKLAAEANVATDNPKAEPGAEEAIRIFEQLREIQQRVMTVFANPTRFNQMGYVLSESRYASRPSADRFAKCQFFFTKNGNLAQLEAYYHFMALGMTHTEAMACLDKVGTGDWQMREYFVDLCKRMQGALGDAELYLTDLQDRTSPIAAAFRWLLYLNVENDTELGRNFNFSIIQGNRSLEHIYPKSKVWSSDTDTQYSSKNGDKAECPEGMLDRKDICLKNEDGTTQAGSATTEHSIGNLVLFYKNENSSLGTGDFAQKKEKIFGEGGAYLFQSLDLLHTIRTFGRPIQWGGKEIAENRLAILRNFEETTKKWQETHFPNPQTHKP